MPKFTKRHYEMIADALNEGLDNVNEGMSIASFNGVLMPFYKLFEADNPKFDRTIFYDRVNK